jgi:hypothetical protein
VTAALEELLGAQVEKRTVFDPMVVAKHVTVSDSAVNESGHVPRVDAIKNVSRKLLARLASQIKCDFAFSVR